MRKRILAALLCACLLVPALTAPAFAAFPDVPADEWYTEYVDFCTEKGIVNGFEDGTFRPTGYLRRSEFIKMLATSATLSYKSELPGKHWAEEYWAMLSENGVLEGLDIPCTFDALQAKTTRYEMAVMIRNFLAKVRGETEAVTNGAARRIPDWAYIPEAYRGAVAQVYAKGIINGMKNTAGAEDGSFCGERKLTRAQASAVMVRLLDPARRAPVDLSDNNPYRLADAPNGLQPFMIWARENGYMLNNNEPRGAFNKLFFGDENKTYFASAEEAAPYMRDVTVNVWQLQPDGTKTQAALKLTVHKYLAADVYEIFQRIFEDEEKFPIASVGGLRCTDTMRHAWGAAVDINPDTNCAADRGRRGEDHGRAGLVAARHRKERVGRYARRAEPVLDRRGRERCEGLRRLRLGLGRNVAVEPRFHAFQRPHRRRLSRIFRIRKIRRNPQKTLNFSLSPLDIKRGFCYSIRAPVRRSRAYYAVKREIASFDGGNFRGVCP